MVILSNFFIIYGSNSVKSEWWDPDPHQRAVDTKISYYES